MFAKGDVLEFKNSSYHKKGLCVSDVYIFRVSDQKFSLIKVFWFNNQKISPTIVDKNGINISSGWLTKVE